MSGCEESWFGDDDTKSCDEDTRFWGDVTWCCGDALLCRGEREGEMRGVGSRIDVLVLIILGWREKCYFQALK